MKKLLFMLVLGVSSVAVASVAPTEPLQIKKPGVIGTDMSKRKIIRNEAPIPKKDNDAVPKLQKYQGVVTQDNMDALENMSRLMQDDPSALMAQFGAPGVQFERSGDTPSYQRTNPSASPAERLNNMQAPVLTGSLPGLEFTKEDVRKEQQKALQQIEAAGRKQLGQKQAPITQMMTVEDIKNSGIDVSQLPEGWEETVNKAYQAQVEMRKKQLQGNKAEKVVAPATQKTPKAATKKAK